MATAEAAVTHSLELDQDAHAQRQGVFGPGKDAVRDLVGNVHGLIQLAEVREVPCNGADLAQDMTDMEGEGV